jgi:hypothetical protein
MYLNVPHAITKYVFFRLRTILCMVVVIVVSPPLDRSCCFKQEISCPQKTKSLKKNKTQTKQRCVCSTTYRSTHLFVVLLYFNIFVVTMSFFFFIFIYKYTYLKITFRSHTALNLKFVFENAYLLHDILFYCSSTPPPQGYDFQRDIDLLWQMESTSHRSASTPIHQGQTYPYSRSVRLFYNIYILE